MIKRLLFVLALLALSLGILTGFYPYWPVLAVLWLGCPQYNPLSAYCGQASIEFILVRAAIAIVSVWVLYRVGVWVCHKDD